jgi:hypothetical protein
MSIETARTGKPSRYLNDEGWQGRTDNRLSPRNDPAVSAEMACWEGLTG